MPESSVTEVVLNIRFTKLAPRYLELQREELPAIKSALGSKDFSALARFGHNIKGTGPSYGLSALTSIGLALEGAGKDKNPDLAGSAIEDLENFLDSVHLSYRNTLLFVDDDPDFLALLEKLFDTGEYISFFASDAKAALAILEDNQVDVIISDLSMPGLGGLELLSTVKERYPRVVRMVLSGQAQVPTILAAINSGQVFRYLTKPWTVDAEARAAVAEAVAYANDLNRNQPNTLTVPLETITHILAVCGHPYVLLGRDNKVLASRAEWALKWPETAEASPGELAELGIETIALDRTHTLRIAQE